MTSSERHVTVWCILMQISLKRFTFVLMINYWKRYVINKIFNSVSLIWKLFHSGILRTHCLPNHHHSFVTLFSCQENTVNNFLSTNVVRVGWRRMQTYTCTVHVHSKYFEKHKQKHAIFPFCIMWECKYLADFTHIAADGELIYFCYVIANKYLVISMPKPWRSSAIQHDKHISLATLRGIGWNQATVWIDNIFTT